MKVWDVMLTWAKKNNLQSPDHRIFMYNQGFSKSRKYWHEIMITIPDNFLLSDGMVKEKIFDGGKYMTMKTDPEHLRKKWHEMGKWKILSGIKESGHQWVEEWLISDWQFPCNGVRIFYPIGE